jgi:hypothetical protein
MGELEESWLRVTGDALPNDVGAYVEDRIRERTPKAF